MNVWWWTALAATFAILWKGTAPRPQKAPPPKEEPKLFETEQEMMGEELPDVSGHIEARKAPVARNPFSGNGHPPPESGTLQGDDQPSTPEVGEDEEFNLEDIEGQDEAEGGI
jgi:hypothetical protein